MNRVVEIRTYNLKRGASEEFAGLFREQAGPMLSRWGVDVIGFGPSLHDENSFYLLRCYASPEDRVQSQDAFYGSDEWISGPRAAVLDCIESYATAVVSLDKETINGLRRAHSEKSVAREG